MLFKTVYSYYKGACLLHLQCCYDIIIIIILFPKHTVITNCKHDQAAIKSQDQQSWLPIITIQIRNYTISKN